MSAVFDTPVRTNVQNLDRIFAAKQPMLLVFQVPDCEPCKKVESIAKDVARTYAGRAIIVLVENSREGSVSAHFNLTRAPTLVFWNGREVTRIEGAARQDEIRAHLDFALETGPSPAAASGPSVPLRDESVPAAPPPGATNGSPVVVTDANFQTQVLQSDLPVLVDFWAPWCGPCRMVSPIVEELGRQYAGRLRVAKVNTDENPMHASRLGIMGIPTLIFFKNGREVDRVVGAVPKATLQSHLDRVLSAP